MGLPGAIAGLLANAAFASGSSLGVDTTNAAGGYPLQDAVANHGANSVGLTVLGDNALTLASSGDSYSGPTTVAAGATLNLDDYNLTTATLTGSGTVNLGPNTLTVANTASSATDSFTGTIEGSGGLVVNDSGADLFELDGTNSFTGATTVAAGTLDLESPLTGPLAVDSNATVTGTDSPLQATIVSGPAAGPGGLPVTFTGSAFDAIALEPTNLQFTWTLTNVHQQFVHGQTGTGANFTFTPSAYGMTDGTYTLSLSAQDSDAQRHRHPHFCRVQRADRAYPVVACNSDQRHDGVLVGRRGRHGPLLRMVGAFDACRGSGPDVQRQRFCLCLHDDCHLYARRAHTSCRWSPPTRAGRRPPAPSASL